MIYPGFIVSMLKDLCRAVSGEDRIEIDNHQSNAMQGIHQARVRLKGDPTTYRMIIAPADAQIWINADKRPVAEAFPMPLGDS